MKRNRVQPATGKPDGLVLMNVEWAVVRGRLWDASKELICSSSSGSSNQVVENENSSSNSRHGPAYPTPSPLFAYGREPLIHGQNAVIEKE